MKRKWAALALVIGMVFGVGAVATAAQSAASPGRGIHIRPLTTDVSETYGPGAFMITSTGQAGAGGTYVSGQYFGFGDTGYGITSPAYVFNATPYRIWMKEECQRQRRPAERLHLARVRRQVKRHGDLQLDRGH